MQTTTNLGLKKPGYNDFADIEDINYNSDILDEEVAAKLTASGGDAANAKIGSATASTASYPVPAAGDTFKVMLGKIRKFCSDIVATFTGATSSAAGKKGLVPAPSSGEQNKYLRGDASWQAPVNNALATAAGGVLDARMGKTLQDEIDSLNSSLANFSSPRYWQLSGSWKGIEVNLYRFGDIKILQLFGLTDVDLGSATSTVTYDIGALINSFQNMYAFSERHIVGTVNGVPYSFWLYAPTTDQIVGNYTFRAHRLHLRTNGGVVIPTETLISVTSVFI